MPKRKPKTDSHLAVSLRFPPQEGAMLTKLAEAKGLPLATYICLFLRENLFSKPLRESL
jgi:hypothetical protein